MVYNFIQYAQLDMEKIIAIFLRNQEKMVTIIGY